MGIVQKKQLPCIFSILYIKCHLLKLFADWKQVMKRLKSSEKLLRKWAKKRLLLMNFQDL